MISINLRISRPYSKWKILKSRNVKLSKNWAFELTLYKSNLLLGMHVETRLTGNHRGLDSGIGLLCHEIEFNIYDIRHQTSEEYL